jgi:hypothetical protein
MSWFAIILTLGTLVGTSRTEKKQEEIGNGEYNNRPEEGSR